VIVDSGIRRGGDIVKCLALGADAVLTGRATPYGVAAGGEEGALKALSILKDEMRRTMAYVGCRKVSDVSDDVLNCKVSRSEGRREAHEFADERRGDAA
jgi:(S)-mandelate dehydrogenase